MVSIEFTQPPPGPFKGWVLDGSRIEHTGDTWRFVNDPVSGNKPPYTDAQIDDYQGLKRREFPWSAPVTLTVRARFSAGIKGTAGFGFWNDPFVMTDNRPPALPRAVWFFYASPDSNMKLDKDLPGHGWKAATIDVIRPGFFALAPLAPLGVLLMNIKPLYRLLWPVGQKAIGVRETLLDVDADWQSWHTYRIEWGKKHTQFYVDDQQVLEAPSPRGRHGFVMWVDNQAMTVTPWGRFGWKTVSVPGGGQWMEISELEIEGN